MHVGMGVIFQATDPKRTDRDVYKAELALGDLAEPLGFDSIWGVEHHFTDYTMCPDVLQYLSYYAGRTKHVKLGSMVVVLPWHDPMRVAEQIAVLDHQSDGRFIFGMGRGLGRVEFDGFGVDQNTARERFVESAQMLLEGLERGWCEFDGKFIKQAKRDIRPRPFKTFKGRTYAAAVSPESSEIMAKLGIGLLIIPQKPWDAVFTEMANYRNIYRQVNKADAPAPILAGWVFCDRDAKKAEAMAREYIGGYWQTVLKHYELAGDHLTKTKGYESYGAMQQMVRGGGADAMIDFFLSLQIWGTPDQCHERIVDFTQKLGAETFTGVFSYAGMPYAMAEENLRLFASDVLPRLKAHQRVKAAAE
ncbi:MAG: LLM class flavin-dependent oxidoreductase [Alphaproteobacteria bacterium]|nr:LLM class flavin-dependent oxidoreductase [Alphaproteobacteria bacterium]MBL6938634.1 LLM class flavin-dependent oxidoreductase [Alphaproteobacteria bacterium]MBL7098009.1 LLM class flavin-dependent oxidoreductase [Alphaproteobacteria bacterium]